MADAWPISESELERGFMQIDQVNTVAIDPYIDEFAEVSLDFPQEIHIGPGYAADLSSDEAALLMLVHELTHLAGENDNLEDFFQAVLRRVDSKLGY